jgi:hypothetical protein
MALNLGQLLAAPVSGLLGGVKAGTGIIIASDGTISATGGGGGVSQILAGTNVTVSPVGGTGVVTINATGGGGGVSQIIAGSNITISPAGGTGAVTINSTPAGGASIPSGTVMSFFQAAAPTGWTKVTNAAVDNAALRLVTGTGGGSGGSTGFTTTFTSYTPGGSVSSSGSCTPQGSVSSSGNCTPQGSISLSGLSVSGLSVSGSVTDTTLSEGQLASHLHQGGYIEGDTGIRGGNNPGPVSQRWPTDSTGGNQGHNHSWFGNVTGGSVTGNASFNGDNTNVNVNSSFNGNNTSVSVNSNFSGSSTSQFAVKYVDFIVATAN